MSEISNLNLFQYVFDWHNDNVFLKLTKPLSILSQKEEYCNNVLMLLFKIDSAFDDLELNRKFISQYQNRDLFEILDIDENAFLKYHLEHFYLQIPTIFDLSLKLINIVYKLDLNGIGINYKEIIKRVEVQDNIKSLMSQFYTQIIKIKEVRNEITHSNVFDEKNIDLLRLTKHLKESSKNGSITKLINEKGVLINEQAYNNILEFITKTNQITFDYIIMLFDYLQESSLPLRL
jgi:hypothetical protein